VLLFTAFIAGDLLYLYVCKVNLQLSSMKWPRDLAKVVDADWVRSDRPVLADARCIRVTDLRLQQTFPSVEEHQVAGMSNVA